MVLDFVEGLDFSPAGTITEKVFGDIPEGVSWLKDVGRVPAGVFSCLFLVLSLWSGGGRCPRRGLRPCGGCGSSRCCRPGCGRGSGGCGGSGGGRGLRGRQTDLFLEFSDQGLQLSYFVRRIATPNQDDEEGRHL